MLDANATVASMFSLATLGVGLVTTAGASTAAAPTPLPSLSIDPPGISMSGLSSGAVTNFLIPHCR
eukprot:SAG22_NODE_15561_length_346_cov_0.611336_1_plen_66_part_00